jgi:hypothetical protein
MRHRATLRATPCTPSSEMKQYVKGAARPDGNNEAEEAEQAED